ncbi:hypothetical protein U1701_17940 [Sphingomonas sp. PB2P19]|uniref:hypothetical protein n=1 Tax=Sphingomonas rhamnosi TaxID=3096156 RepID=UPI002FC99ABC
MFDLLRPKRWIFIHNVSDQLFPYHDNRRYCFNMLKKSKPAQPRRISQGSVHTPEELRDLLLEVIVGAAGGDEAKWRKALGEVEKLSIAFNASRTGQCIRQERRRRRR